MPRIKKDNTPISIKLDTTIYNRLLQYCEDSGQTKTVAIERALSAYMDDYEHKKDLLNEKLNK